MGISVGWGDRYGSGLPDQYIDVTDLNSGNYRLIATADAGNRFAESNETNNTTWVDLKLTLNHKGKGSGGNKVNVIGYGPTPDTGIRASPSFGIDSRGGDSIEVGPALRTCRAVEDVVGEARERRGPPEVSAALTAPGANPAPPSLSSRPRGSTPRSSGGRLA